MSLEKNIERLQSIDALRGLVIIIMLLDHVRETFYLHKQVTDPMDVTVTELALFGGRLLGPYLCSGFCTFNRYSLLFHFNQKNRTYNKRVPFY